MLNSWHSLSARFLSLLSRLEGEQSQGCTPACPSIRLLMGIKSNRSHRSIFSFSGLSTGTLGVFPVPSSWVQVASWAFVANTPEHKVVRAKSCPDEERTVEKESNLFPATEDGYNGKEAGGKRKFRGGGGKRKAGGTQEKATACDETEMRCSLYHGRGIPCIRLDMSVGVEVATEHTVVGCRCHFEPGNCFIYS